MTWHERVTVTVLVILAVFGCGYGVGWSGRVSARRSRRLVERLGRERTAGGAAEVWRDTFKYALSREALGKNRDRVRGDFLERLPSVAVADFAETINVSPGDVVVMRVNANVTRDQAAVWEEIWRERVPDVSLMVVSRHVEGLTVLSREEVPA